MNKFEPNFVVQTHGSPLNSDLREKKKLASQASISSSRAPFLDDGFFKRRFVLSLSVREHGIEQSAGLGEPWTIANTHPCGKPKNKKPTVT